jgi:hypothetical protein
MRGRGKNPGTRGTSRSTNGWVGGTQGSASISITSGILQAVGESTGNSPAFLTSFLLRRRIRACLLRCGPSGPSTDCRVRLGGPRSCVLYLRPPAPPPTKRCEKGGVRPTSGSNGTTSRTDAPWFQSPAGISGITSDMRSPGGHSGLQPVGSVRCRLRPTFRGRRTPSPTVAVK